MLKDGEIPRRTTTTVRLPNPAMGQAAPIPRSRDSRLLGGPGLSEVQPNTATTFIGRIAKTGLETARAQVPSIHLPRVPRLSAAADERSSLSAGHPSSPKPPMQPNRTRPHPGRLPSRIRPRMARTIASSSALVRFAHYSQVDRGLRYKSVNFGAEKSPSP